MSQSGIIQYVVFVIINLFSHSNGYEVVLQCYFYFHFPNDVKNLIMCLFSIFFLRSFFSYLPFIFNLGYLFTLIYELLIYSGYKSFIRYVLYKYFLPVYGLLFHFLINVFQRAEDFNSD